MAEARERLRRKLQNHGSRCLRCTKSWAVRQEAWAVEPQGLQMARKQTKIKSSCVSCFSWLRNHHKFVNAYVKTNMIRLAISVFACFAIFICLIDVATARQPHSSVVIGESLANVKNPKSDKLDSPFGIDFDKQGNMYIVELSGGRVHKLDTAGNLTTIAGDGSKDYSGDNGPAKDATFNGMHNVAVTPLILVTVITFECNKDAYRLASRWRLR